MANQSALTTKLSRWLWPGRIVASARRHPDAPVAAPTLPVEPVREALQPDRPRSGKHAERRHQLAAVTSAFVADHLVLLGLSPIPAEGLGFSRQLARLDPMVVEAFDATCRRQLPWSSHERLLDRRKRLLRWLKQVPESAPLFAFDLDGHVRAAAAKAVPGAREPMAMALALLIRTNDWVPNVRELARDQLDAALDRLDPADLARLPPLLLDLMPTWTRGGSRPAAASCLVRPDLREAVIHHLRQEVSGPLARRLGVLLRDPRLDNVLPGLARDARSSAVRATALEALLTNSVRWPEGWIWVWIDKPLGIRRRERRFVSRPLTEAPADLAPLLASGAADKSTLVRRIVADALIRLGPGFLEAEAVGRLRRDKSAAVAERMAFYDRKWGDAEMPALRRMRSE